MPKAFVPSDLQSLVVERLQIRRDWRCHTCQFFASLWVVVIALTAAFSSAEKRNPVGKTKAAYPNGCFLDSAFQRNDDLPLSGRKANGKKSYDWKDDSLCRTHVKWRVKSGEWRIRYSLSEEWKVKSEEFTGLDKGGKLRCSLTPFAIPSVAGRSMSKAPLYSIGSMSHFHWRQIALQKTAFCLPICRLLHADSRPFARQSAMCWFTTSYEPMKFRVKIAPFIASSSGLKIQILDSGGLLITLLQNDKHAAIECQSRRYRVSDDAATRAWQELGRDDKKEN